MRFFASNLSVVVTRRVGAWGDTIFIMIFDYYVLKIRFGWSSTENTRIAHSTRPQQNPQSNSLSTSRAVQHHTCIFTRSTTARRALGTGMGHAHTLIMMIERGPTLSETQASYPSTRACRRNVEGHRAASDALHNCPTHGACPDNRWWVVAMECGARGH